MMELFHLNILSFEDGIDFSLMDDLIKSDASKPTIEQEVHHEFFKFITKIHELEEEISALKMKCPRVCKIT